MIRHDWTLALGLGICGSLLAGCTSPAQLRASQELKSQLEKVEAAAQPSANTQAASSPQSPYGLQPVQLTPVQAYVDPELPEKLQPALSAEILPVAAHPTTLQDVPKQQPAVDAKPQAVVEVKPQPAVEESPVLTALRCLMEQRSEEAITYLLKFDKPTQDLLLCLLPVVARLGTGSLETASAPDIAHLMDQMESAVGFIGLRAPLVLDRLAYCRDIDRFGIYDPLPDDYPFRPGEVGEVYVELRNVGSEHRGTFYDTRLNATVELRDAAGNTRPLRVLPGRRVADRSRSPRHDHFQSYRFCVPENLRPGYYTLILHVNDAVTQRTAQKTLPLRITTRPMSNP